MDPFKDREGKPFGSVDVLARWSLQYPGVSKCSSVAWSQAGRKALGYSLLANVKGLKLTSSCEKLRKRGNLLKRIFSRGLLLRQPKAEIDRSLGWV